MIPTRRSSPLVLATLLLLLGAAIALFAWLRFTPEPAPRVSRILAPGVPSERKLSFPTDREVGRLATRPWGSSYPWDWMPLRPGRGEVVIPAGTEVKLAESVSGAHDRSWFAAIPPDAIQELSLAPTAPVGNDLAGLRHWTALRSLSMRRSTIGDSELGYLPPLPSLKRLDLGQIQIADEGWRTLQVFDSLQVLDIHGTPITGRTIDVLARLPALRGA